MARRSNSSRRRTGSPRTTPTGNAPTSGRTGSSRTGSGRTGSGRTGRARAGGGRNQRSDGRVDVSCPQCGTGFRVGADMLDSKLECTECHRVFFPKTTAGKRVAAPDHTKAYVIFGVVAVVIIGVFMLSSQGGGKAPSRNVQAAQKPKAVAETVYSHARTNPITEWAKAMAEGNRLTVSRHSDLAALASQLGVAGEDGRRPEDNAVLDALMTDPTTELLRTMRPSSAELSSEADMTAATGNAIVFVSPRDGDERFARNTNGRFSISFRMDGDRVRVTGFEMQMAPIYNAGKDPSIKTYKVNEDINKPDEVQISDTGGTRTVRESEPAPVPHWSGATPELREKADAAVAGIIRFANDKEAPGGLYNKAIDSIRSMDEKKAAVPRVLNAMNDCYQDVIQNHDSLVLLDKALQHWTGYAVNYPRLPSGNADNDKKLRQSCIRQWFAFWYRYSNDLSEWIDSRENLEEEGDDGGK